MEAVRERPLFTKYYDSVAQFQPEGPSTYIYAASLEERSAFADAWLTAQRSGGVQFVRIVEQRHEDAQFRARLDDGTEIPVSLRSRGQLSSFVDGLATRRVYLDITGQDQSTWAGLLRACLAKRIETMVVYTEPMEYSYSTAPIEGEIFDLSERIRGLEPLPGFARLHGSSDDFILVPLLGFEGPRFAYLVQQLQPDSDNIYPIVGLPGFRHEYPFYTYWCNKTTLVSTRAYRQVRYARANCPFSLFHVASDIMHRNAEKPLRIAPIGTKPHAVGAVLFVLANASSGQLVELVYDHPIRKAKRTSGASRVAVYYVSSFLPAT